MKKRQPKCAKETFWNKLRVQNNYLIKNLAKDLGVARGTLGSWLCGKVIPSERNIWNICDKFGIDYNTGYNEFVKASNLWDSERGRLKYNMYSPITPEDTEPIKRRSGIRRSHKSAPVSTNTDISNEILHLLYGKLPYAEYAALQRNPIDLYSALRTVYGKVSLEDFNALFELLSDK